MGEWLQGFICGIGAMWAAIALMGIVIFIGAVRNCPTEEEYTRGE